MEELLVGVAVLFVFMVLVKASKRGAPANNMAALAQIDGKIDALIQKAGIRYNADLPPGVGEALQQGNKIEAIKLYRGATGVGLKQAKDFVEGLGLYHIEKKLDALLKEAGVSYTPALYRPQYRAAGAKGGAASGAKGSAGPEAMAEIQGLIRAGDMIQAIKRYREATGVGLKEAKDAVEAMKRAGV